MILHGSNLTADKKYNVIYKKTPAVCRGEGEEGETCECAFRTISKPQLLRQAHT